MGRNRSEKERVETGNAGRTSEAERLGDALFESLMSVLVVSRGEEGDSHLTLSDVVASVDAWRKFRARCSRPVESSKTREEKESPDGGREAEKEFFEVLEEVSVCAGI